MSIEISAIYTWIFISLILLSMESRGAIEINRPFEPVFFCLAAPAYVPAVFLIAAVKACKWIFKKIRRSEFVTERIRKREERRRWI